MQATKATQRSTRPATRSTTNRSNPPTPLRATLMALMATLTAAAPALAEPAAIRQVEPAPARTPGTPTDPFSARLLLQQQYNFRADLEGDSGSVSIYRLESGAELTYRPSDLWSFSATTVGELSAYDFSNSARIAPPPPADPARRGDPFDNFYDLSTFLRATRAFDNGYSLTLGGTASASWEDGADFSDSLTAGAIAAVGYRFSPTLFLSLGAGVRTRLEDDAIVVPFIALRWNITDTVTLASEGLGLRLTSRLNDQFTVGLMAQYQSREYRLDNDHNNELIDEGVFRDDRVEIAALAEWRPLPRFTVEGRAGVTAWQEFELLNDRGRTTNEVETDPAAFVWLGLAYSF